MDENQQEILQVIYGEYQNLMSDLNTISFWNSDKYKQLFDVLLQISLIRSVHASEEFYEAQLFLLKELPENVDFFEIFQYYIAGEIINWDNFYMLNEAQKMFFYDKTADFMSNYLIDNFTGDKKIEKLFSETSFAETMGTLIASFNTTLIDKEEAYIPISSAILEYQKNCFLLD